MKQKKQTHHSKPHGGSVPYVQKQQTTRRVYAQAVCDTYCQFVFDIACVVLHRHFGWGKERLTRFHGLLMEMEGEFVSALAKENESGYMRTKLDRELQDIFGQDKVEPFEKRYEWMEDII